MLSYNLHDCTFKQSVTGLSRYFKALAISIFNWETQYWTKQISYECCFNNVSFSPSHLPFPRLCCNIWDFIFLILSSNRLGFSTHSFIKLFLASLPMDSTFKRILRYFSRMTSLYIYWMDDLFMFETFRLSVMSSFFKTSFRYDCLFLKNRIQPNVGVLILS